MRSAVIVGLSGLELTAEESEWLATARPAGVILFARNCANPVQVRKLTNDVRSAVGQDDTLVLIDQEGGRVRRLRPPYWRDIPSAEAYRELQRFVPRDGRDAAYAVARMTAEELREIGVNMSCAPVLDLGLPGAHEIIGDRAYGSTPDEIVPLAEAVMTGLMDGGVAPVVKHIPGHGRALADSHLELPVVTTPRAELTTTDFAPFRRLATAPAAMTAHVVYRDVDPSAPASTSRLVVEDVIRAEIGFDGLLMSDDLGMKALTGTTAERARAVIVAGCDVALECSGKLDDAAAAALAVPSLGGAARRRFDACLEISRQVHAFDRVRADALWRQALQVEAQRTAESV